MGYRLSLCQEWGILQNSPLCILSQSRAKKGLPKFFEEKEKGTLKIHFVLWFELDVGMACLRKVK